jgi:hypothetical protein
MKKSMIFLSLFFINQGWALSCSAPVTISEPGEIHSSPKAAINAKGEAVVAWKSVTTEESHFIQAATCNAEKKWSGAQPLGSSEEIGSPPKLYMDGEGNAYATWVYKKENKIICKFSKKDRQGWCPATQIADFQEGMVPLGAAFDMHGNLIIACMHLQDQSKTSFIHYRHATNEKEHKIPLASPAFRFNFISNPQKEVAVLGAEDRQNWFFGQSACDIQLQKLKPNGEWTRPVTLGKFDRANFSPEEVEQYFSSMNSHENLAFIWISGKGQTPAKKIQAAVLTRGMRHNLSR